MTSLSARKDGEDTQIMSSKKLMQASGMVPPPPVEAESLC